MSQKMRGCLSGFLNNKVMCLILELGLGLIGKFYSRNSKRNKESDHKSTDPTHIANSQEVALDLDR